MKRYFGFAPIAIFVLLLTLLLLPTSEAKRNDRVVRHSLPASREPFPDLFKLDKQEQHAGQNQVHIEGRQHSGSSPLVDWRSGPPTAEVASRCVNS